MRRIALDLDGPAHLVRDDDPGRRAAVHEGSRVVVRQARDDIRRLVHRRHVVPVRAAGVAAAQAAKRHARRHQPQHAAAAFGAGKSPSEGRELAGDCLRVLDPAAPLLHRWQIEHSVKGRFGMP